MASSLQGKTIAILATDGFEQSELAEPKRAVEDAARLYDLPYYLASDLAALETAFRDETGVVSVIEVPVAG